MLMLLRVPRSLPLVLVSSLPAATAQLTCPTWSDVGAGVSNGTAAGTVWAQAAFDDGSGPRLFVAGSFDMAGSTSVANVAAWDGAAWSSLGPGSGPGTNGPVSALAVFDDDGPGPRTPALYVGGTFTDAGGVPVQNLARWDGASWSDVGGGLFGLFGGSVDALEVFDDDGAGPGLPALYVGGIFSTAGSAGTLALNVARWDGTAFSALDVGVNNGVIDLVAYDEGSGTEHLFAAGYFTQAGSSSASAAMIARWDGAQWSQVGGGLLGDGFVPHVSALHVFDDGSGPALFAGGTITAAEGAPKQRVARWDGSLWSGVGTGLTGGDVIALADWDDGGGSALYAGGALASAGPTALENIARWDGTSWEPVASAGPDKLVLSFATYDDGNGPGLFVGGDFTQIGALGVSALARVAPAASPTVYCTAMPSSQGCVPILTTNGLASVGSVFPFRIDVAGTQGQSLGLLAYGTLGPAAIPYGSGILCVRPPLRRLPVAATGGSGNAGACDGSLSFDFNAYLASGANPALAAGTQIHAQAWVADAGLSTGGALTSAVAFAICP